MFKFDGFRKKPRKSCSHAKLFRISAQIRTKKQKKIENNNNMNTANRLFF